MEPEVELPYLLEPVALISNATESLEHLRLVFRGICLEHSRTAGHRLLGRPTPQMREQVDLHAGLIECDANLAVTLGVLLRRAVQPVHERDRFARRLGDEATPHPVLARMLPAVAREHRIHRELRVGGGHQVGGKLGVVECGGPERGLDHDSDSKE